MSRLLVEGGDLTFWCPGCDQAHMIRHGDGPGPRWGWNGSAESPTFTPSVLVRGTKMTERGRADYDAWRDAGFPRPAPEQFDSGPTVCHSFVTDGQIKFLGDCTHALAGQTVPLPEFSWGET